MMYKNISILLTMFISVALLTSTASATSPTCSSYCTGLGVGYTDGTCRQNSAQCTGNGQVYESGGNSLCTGGPSADTCCCTPSVTTSSSTTTSTSTTSSTTTTTITYTCGDFCIDMGVGYTGGTCRQTPGTCATYSEDWQNNGNKYCTEGIPGGGAGAGNCCCSPSVTTTTSSTTSSTSTTSLTVTTVPATTIPATTVPATSTLTASTTIEQTTTTVGGEPVPEYPSLLTPAVSLIAAMGGVLYAVKRK